MVNGVFKNPGGLKAKQKAHLDSNSLSKVNDALPIPSHKHAQLTSLPQQPSHCTPNYPHYTPIPPMIPLVRPRLPLHDVSVNTSTRARRQHDEPCAPSSPIPSGCKYGRCDEDIFRTIQDHDTFHHCPVQGVCWTTGEAVHRVADAGVEDVGHAKAEKDGAEDGAEVGENGVAGEAHCGGGVGVEYKRV